MRRFLFIVTCVFFIQIYAGFAQVKPQYLYNTGTPFGTLDIRTRISSSDYYYLVEGKTFSFRERAPGVPTESYLKMTNFDTEPYTQGHMRHKQGSSDRFEMNYRFLLPRGHRADYRPGYPMIVLMHGAVERANCYYEECYHGGWEYDPNTNIPAAPSDVDHKLLNNDHHLAIGAREHLAARNRAGDRLPDDASMPERAFPGFVLMPQMFNDWDSLWVEKVLRMVQLHIEKYNVDPNRVYIHGLSIGGYATYEAIKRAPWLFTAALPMSAVSEAAKIFEHNQQGKVAHIPLWLFQGGRDKEPTVAWTKAVLQKFRDAGNTTRYTEYPDLGHNVWGRAYAETDFFTWMLKRNKSDIHPLFEQTEINKKENQFPELVLAEGFFAYQWEKDGEIIRDAISHRFIPTEPGEYRARFSRVPSPGSNDWNRWSSPVVITRIDEDEEVPNDEENPDGEEQPDDDDEPADEDEDSAGEDEPDEETPDQDNPEDTPDQDTPGDTPGEDESEGDVPDEGESEGEPGDDVAEDDPDSGDDSGENDGDSSGDDNTDGEDGADENEDTDGNHSGDGSSDENETPGNGGDSNTDENTDGEDNDEVHEGNPGEEGDGLVTNLPEERELRIEIFPNPVSSGRITLHVENPTGQAIQYKLTDALGRGMASGQIHGSTQLVIRSDQELKEGMYILTVRHGKREIKKRVVVHNQ